MDVTLPDLGENIEEAEVLSVLVQKGDAVAKDQPVLELETDKATFELPCLEAGTVSAIHVKQGDTVRVGQKILSLEASAAAGDGRDARRPRAAARASRPEQPEEDGAGDTGAKEPAGAGEPAAERSARRERQPEGDSAGGGRPAGRPRAEAPRESPEPGAREKPVTARARQAAPAGDDARDEPADRERRPTEVEVAAGPTARRLARELEVDLLRIRGTGSGGRITPEDVQAFVRERAAAAPEPEATADTATADEKGERRLAADGEEIERRPLTGIEKAAIRHLSASWSEIPHVTHHDLADVTALEESRRRHEAARNDAEPKLTWTALVVKAVAAGLRSFPRFNSRLDLEREELVLKRRIHVGVAVDTEHGLLVPVLRDVDRRTTREIAVGIAGLAERARARKLSREDLQGAGFTVTNLGGIGGVAFTPIVSRPEVAILGVSRSREELALRDGQVVRRIALPLSLSYDHRAINGADAARFVRYVAQLLEDPVNLLMES